MKSSDRNEGKKLMFSTKILLVR